MNKISLPLLVFVVTAGAAMLLPTPAAHAQSTGLLPIRAKLGVVLPSNTTTKDRVGDVIPTGEIDLRIPRFLGGSFASIGYQERGGLRTVPITISRTYGPANPLQAVTGNVYFGLGAGVYLLHGDDGVGSSNSKTTVGGFGQIGYQFPNPYFVEAKYQAVVGKADGLTPNGLVLFVGRRF